MNHPSVLLDLVVFVVVIAQVRLVKSIHPGMNVSAIFNTVGRDTEIYFAIISSSHILILVMYSVESVGSLYKYLSLPHAD